MAIMLALSLVILAAWPARAAPFAATVMDARTGQILYATNDTTRLHPASLTKMMTLYVVFEAIRNGEISLDTRVRISRRAAAEPPSRLGLRAGQRVQVRHLIRAAALRSGNDAATALAEAVSGSVEAFARRMNATAAAIGMTQTSFRNAHGLTQAGHLSSARDMTILGRQLYFDFPEYYGLFSRRSEDAGIATVTNTNGRFLDGYAGADGIKTGFTSAAGYNLTAMAERGGVRVVVTVFGGRSIQHRHEMVTQLMDRGFREAPRRAAVRRPPTPDYRRPPPRAAEAAEVAEAPGATGTRAAGRVIRLQTAPARSPFPQRRPVAPVEPPPELLAAVQQSVEAALAVPAAEAAPPETGSAPVAAVAAPERSPQPPARPAALAAAVAALQPDDSVQAARAAGFAVIDPETYAALTAPPEPVPEAGVPLVAAVPAPVPADDSAAAAPAPAPAAPEAAVAEPPAAPPPEAPAGIAAVRVEDGLVRIPGLPPIPLAQPADEAPPPEADPGLALAPRDEPALVVTAGGQILWHDQDVLTALDRIAPPVGPAALLLTTEDVPDTPPAPILPEIVVRTASSGGQLWAVDLGAYGSRFDAERILLRAALAESSALGSGVRRVEPRGGAHRALVVSLTEDQASRACARLTLTAQPCTVLAP